MSFKRLLCVIHIIFIVGFCNCLLHISLQRQKQCSRWTVRGSNPGGVEIFHSHTDWPWGPPSLPANHYWSFKSRINETFQRIPTNIHKIYSYIQVLSSFCDTQFPTHCTISKQFHITSPCLLIYMVSPVFIMDHKKRRKENKRNWHSTTILTIIEMSHLFHTLLLYKHFIYLYMAQSQLWLKFWTQSIVSG